MPEIRFYHLQKSAPEKVVPDLIGKGLERGFRILLKVPNKTRSQFYDDWLWRFQPDSFLPHGKEGDVFAEQQPVWLGTTDDAPNAAKMALVVEGAEMPAVGQFDLVCNIFDSENEDNLSRARQLWTDLKKNPDLTLTYWQQQDNGGWAKKNV
jgi:DNA polymerase III subunit chi